MDKYIRTLSNQYNEENIPHFDHNCCSLKYFLYFPSHVNHVWFLPKSATSTNVSKVRKKWKIDFFSNYSCVLGWQIFAKSMDGKTSERIHSPINLRKGSKIMFFWGIIIILTVSVLLNFFLGLEKRRSSSWNIWEKE